MIVHSRFHPNAAATNTPRPLSQIAAYRMPVGIWIHVKNCSLAAPKRLRTASNARHDHRHEDLERDAVRRRSRARSGGEPAPASDRLHRPLPDPLGAPRRPARRNADRHGAARAERQGARIGVCNFGPLDLAEALEKHRVETNQLAYSLLARGVEFEVQPMCVERQIGLLCYSPLAQGLLAGRYQSADDVPAERAARAISLARAPQARHGQAGCEAETFDAVREVRQVCDDINQPMADVAIAWLLQQPAVTSVLAGASRPDQVVQNVRRASLHLSDETREKLNRATGPVKEKMGPNCDLWQAAGPHSLERPPRPADAAGD